MKEDEGRWNRRRKRDWCRKMTFHDSTSNKNNFTFILLERLLIGKPRIVQKGS